MHLGLLARSLMRSVVKIAVRAPAKQNVQEQKTGCSGLMQINFELPRNAVMANAVDYTAALPKARHTTGAPAPYGPRARASNSVRADD
jgi:hypothetical protein